VILLFEAIYYLKSVESFLLECRRVLRPGGLLLIVTANKDIDGFNRSPHTYEYYGVAELTKLLTESGFVAELFGDCPISEVGLKQKLLQPVKKAAVQWNLIPKTMAGKKFLKRLVFGKLVEMPSEITKEMGTYEEPTPIEAGVADRNHKVVFCKAKMVPIGRA